MHTLNQTPFSVASHFGYDSHDRAIALVVCKATYAWDEQGRCTPAPEQPPVCTADVCSADNPQAVLLEADWAPEKPRVDVLLVGDLVLRVPVARSACRLQVGARLVKTAALFGPRRWEKGLWGVRTTEPEVFERLSLSWEHSYGGTDPEDPRACEPRNPVGRGVAHNDASLVGRDAPHIEHPHLPQVPLGFGPVGRHFWPRAQRAGTFNAATPLPFLPPDFDPRFYNCAPDDQQLEGYIPGEVIELTGMTSKGQEHFALPEHTVPMTFVDARGRRHARTAAPDTVVIQPSERTVSILARTTLPLDATRKLPQLVVVDESLSEQH